MNEDKVIMGEALMFAINNLYQGEKLDKAVSIYKNLVGIKEEGNEQTN